MICEVVAGTPNENALQGDFGESWLRTVAAGCGLLHGRPTTVDLDKADVELTQRGVVDGTYCPTVKVQVKTTTNLRITGDGRIAYDLDAATYEVLRRKDHSVRRVLVVTGLPDDGARVQLVKGRYPTSTSGRKRDGLSAIPGVLGCREGAPSAAPGLPTGLGVDLGR